MLLLLVVVVVENDVEGAKHISSLHEHVV